MIHGSYGNPNENWFPWLKKELEKGGHSVFIPVFPTPENQSLKDWEEVFNKECLNKIDGESILIGHSIGVAFILSILEELSIQKPIRACYFISGFLGLLNKDEFDAINKTFSDKRFDWGKIKRSCKNFYVYHSDNDPYVPLEKARELANKLNTEVKVIKGAGHFNKNAGYNKFPLLLNDIKNSL